LGNLKERDRLGDPVVDGKIIIRSSGSGMWVYGLDLADLGWDRWWALVTMVMNLRVP
jgi:hypothetical protein